MQICPTQYLFACYMLNVGRILEAVAKSFFILLLSAVGATNVMLNLRVKTMKFLTGDSRV